jgi:hypothetical protein
MRTRFLIGSATFLSGLLAGEAFDRVVVGGPAWHHLGANAWADYSRYADLGVGLAAYPIEAIGAAVLLFAAIVSRHFDARVARGPALALYLAAGFSVLGLLLTIKAAPIMLSLAVPQSTEATERAFQGFYFWGLYFRGAVDLIAFACSLWALDGRASSPCVRD